MRRYVLKQYSMQESLFRQHGCHVEHTLLRICVCPSQTIHVDVPTTSLDLSWLNKLKTNAKYQNALLVRAHFTPRESKCVCYSLKPIMNEVKHGLTSSRLANSFACRRGEITMTDLVAIRSIWVTASRVFVFCILIFVGFPHQQLHLLSRDNKHVVP